MNQNYQRNNSDNQPILSNQISNPIIPNPYSLDTDSDDENGTNGYSNNRGDNDKFHNLSTTMNFLNKTTPYNKIQIQQKNYGQIQRRNQVNKEDRPHSGRRTIVKKLPPTNYSMNDAINPFNRQMNEQIMNNPINNQLNNNINMPIMAPIDNKKAVNSRNNIFDNNPKVKVQMIDSQGNPIKKNSNNLIRISPNKNFQNNSLNNMKSNVDLEQRFNPPSPRNQTINTQNININYMSQNQPLNPLLNKQKPIKQIQQFQKSNPYMNPIQNQPITQNQNNYNENMKPIINQNQIMMSQNKNNFINNQNQNENLINENQNQGIPNKNNIAHISPEGNNLVNVETSRITMTNEESEEQQKENEKKDNNNKINISYTDFDDSGWVKNYGGVTRPGKNSKGLQKINQDSLVSLTNINNIKDFNIFGVLDGHGVEGHNVSEFASDFIPSKIINHPEIKCLSDPEEIYEKLKENNCQIITEAYLSCDEQLKNMSFDAYNSGSTCILVIHIGNHIICSNVGDSRAMVAYDDELEGDSELNYLETAQLSIDYKPEVEDERKRILSSGGTVEQMKNYLGQGIGPYRVWAKGRDYPGLAMSRSIGDLKAKNIGIISDPGILEYELSESTKFIVVCSDGVWEFLSNETVKNYGRSFYLNNNASGFCHQVVDQSVVEWEKNDNVIDDITIVVAFFNI